VKIIFNGMAQVPKLAWCAGIKKGNDEVELLHGPWVETSHGFFCEGAWSGEFAAGAFDSSILVGTAGKLTRDGLLLATPNHTLDRIYLLALEHAMLASNSLPFLLAQAEDDVDTRHLSYASELASIIEGLKKHVRYLPTLKGRRVRLCYHANILITPDLQVIERPKPPVRAFRDFADYRGFLAEQVKAIAANAGDRRRRVKYRPIVTVSSGYDSSAAAVLAREAGCKRALTFHHSRPRAGLEQGPDDSGADVAARLGLEVKSFGRRDYLKDPTYTEAENEGLPLALASFREELEGGLLITGYQGGVWERQLMSTSPDIVRADYSAGSMTEFRLRVGFLHLPVPFLGCTSLRSIWRISNAPEMAPWRLMTNYDKPIPRRIVEEAGIARELFASSKKASEAVARIEGIERVMKKESLEAFGRFCDANWNARSTLKDRVMSSLQSAHRLNSRFNRRMFQVTGRRFRRPVRLPHLLPRPLRLVTYDIKGRERLLFHWAVRTLLPRYHPDVVGYVLLDERREPPPACGPAAGDAPAPPRWPGPRRTHVGAGPGDGWG